MRGSFVSVGHFRSMNINSHLWLFCWIIPSHLCVNLASASTKYYYFLKKCIQINKSSKIATTQKHKKWKFSSFSSILFSYIFVIFCDVSENCCWKRIVWDGNEFFWETRITFWPIMKVQMRAKIKRKKRENFQFDPESAFRFHCNLILLMHFSKGPYSIILLKGKVERVKLLFKSWIQEALWYFYKISSSMFNS